MQEQQEPSVNDILSSIRQILSNKIEGEETSDMGTVDEVRTNTPLQTEPEAERKFSQTTDVFLLTPQMRSDGGGQVVDTIEPVQQEITPQQDALSDTPHIDVKPMVQEWLDKNLPALVERIVAEEVRRIFNKR